MTLKWEKKKKTFFFKGILLCSPHTHTHHVASTPCSPGPTVMPDKQQVLNKWWANGREQTLNIPCPQPHDSQADVLLSGLTTSPLSKAPETQRRAEGLVLLTPTAL